MDYGTTDAPNNTTEMTEVPITDEQPAAKEASTEEKKKPDRTKLIIGVLFLAVVAYIIVDSFTTKYVRGFVSDFLDWFEENTVAGAFLFIVVYAVCTVFLIPGSVLTLGAGFVFASALGNLGLGVAIGSLVVITGASIGAIGGFLVGRYLLRDTANRLAEKYTLFQAIDSALEQQGLKIFFLLRLSPIAPFNIMNYLGGVSAVTFRDYTISLLGISPGSIVYVFFGASAGSLAEGGGGNRTVTIIVTVVGSILGIAAIWLTTRYARQELNRILEEKKKAEAEEAGDVEEGEAPESANPTAEKGELQA